MKSLLFFYFLPGRIVLVGNECHNMPQEIQRFNMSLLRVSTVGDESGQSDMLNISLVVCTPQLTWNSFEHGALIPVPNPRQWLNFLEYLNKEGSLSDDVQPARTGLWSTKVNVSCLVAGVIVSHAQLSFRLCFPPLRLPCGMQMSKEKIILLLFDRKIKADSCRLSLSYFSKGWKKSL